MDGVCNQNWTTHPLDNPWTTSPQSLGNISPQTYISDHTKKKLGHFALVRLLLQKASSNLFLVKLIN